MIRHGERLLPPHKTWTRDLAPTHTHLRFHPSSWRPLRYRRLAWHKWLFGLQSRIGFSHYATFWSDTPSRRACDVCGMFRSNSVHRVLAHCVPTQPLVCAWLSSWPSSARVATWHQTACRADLRVIARLAIPQSLYKLLISTSGGVCAARKLVGAYQSLVIDRGTVALSFATLGSSSRRPNVFGASHWGDVHTQTPLLPPA